MLTKTFKTFKACILFTLTILCGADLTVVSAADVQVGGKNLHRNALVIGNSRYRNSPLLNPINDAKAVADRLTQSGFEVTVKFDLSKNEFMRAFDDFGKDLATNKGVGLFYFAGHGAQLNWSNFLIPVDAEIKTASEMKDQAVDISKLLYRLHAAKNPVNIVILDACRDNPFGLNNILIEKGLSQIDAPVGTLLAYATAPGNVASDGERSNGLYTEYLLHEMEIPGEKIEDVFKRARHKVRRASEGRQVPWESTSLEDDFYLLPPLARKGDSDPDIDKQYAEELALWESVKASTNPESIESYITKYPTGQFSELAMFKIERMLAQQGQQVVRSKNTSSTPFSAGTARVRPYRVGDKYTYRKTNPLTGEEISQFTNSVTAVADDEVIFNNGRRVTDLLGNGLVTGDGRRRTPYQLLVPEYWVGKKWSTQFDMVFADGRQQRVFYDVRVTKKETVIVPAGTFDAFRVEAYGTTNRGGSLSIKLWVAPDKVNGYVIYERIHRNKAGKYTDTDRNELISVSVDEVK